MIKSKPFSKFWIATWFHLIYAITMVSCLSCKTFTSPTSDEMFIKSPGYPTHYSSNDTCNYEIEAPVGLQVEVLLDVHFYGDACAYKPAEGVYISYTDEPAESDTENICKDTDSYLIRSRGRKLYIKFVVRQTQIVYEGRYKNVPTNLCGNHLCFNGGSCIVVNSNRFCVCPKEFSGYACTECKNHTCYNDGHCTVHKDGRRKCTCQNNYTGKFCEQTVSPCPENPCKHGKCIESFSDNMTISEQLHITQNGTHISDFRCMCDEGFSGRYCDTDIDDCVSNPCPFGECIDEIDGYYCKCPECHFGWCVREDVNVFCKCFPGFQGVQCSDNINECVSSPCVHGDCTDYINGYMCSCHDNYTGSNCERLISLHHHVQSNNSDVCSIHNPCFRGKCHQSNVGSICTCVIGYHGYICDQPVSFLVSNQGDINTNHHLCFKKKDVENECACLFNVCHGGDPMLIFLCESNTKRLLKKLCETQNGSTYACFIERDIEMIHLVSLLCEKNKTTYAHSTEPSAANKGGIHNFSPSYIFNCQQTDTDQIFDINIVSNNSEGPFLYSNLQCIINSSNIFRVILEKCALTKLLVFYDRSDLSAVSLNTNTSLYFEIHNVSQVDFTEDKLIHFKPDYQQKINACFTFRNQERSQEQIGCYRGLAIMLCERKRSCDQDSCIYGDCFVRDDSIMNDTVCRCYQGFTGDNCNITRNNVEKQKTHSNVAVYVIVSLLLFFVIIIPTVGCVCVRNSRKRGSVRFDKMQHVNETCVPNFINSRDIFLANWLYEVDGVESGKSEA